MYVSIDRFLGLRFKVVILRRSWNCEVEYKEETVSRAKIELYSLIYICNITAGVFLIV